MIALSLYSGECDGLGYAAEIAGIEVAAYCESNPKRRERLAEKHPDKPIFESDEEVTVDAMQKLALRPDIIFGGPPCQPFSVAGAKRGTADPRHRWPQMRRIIRELRPRWVVIENVGGFVRLALDLVLADLEAEGYEAGAVVLPALAVGAPHRRDRCFVVGFAFGIGQAGNHGRPAKKEPADGCVGGANGRVEHPRRAGREERDASAVAGDAEHAAGRPDTDWLERAAQPRLGRVLDGVSHRLDEQMSRWPAWRGQAQHSSEPPRVAAGMKERPRRIESLGLAVVPWQAYPIFALLRELDGILQEEGDGRVCAPS